jgi:hypothetical protein
MIERFMVPVLSFKRFEDFPIPFVPAEGNAPSLAHLGQAACLGLQFLCSALEVDCG